MYPTIHPYYIQLMDREVDRYAKRGYLVVARTPTTAQLVKPKQFSCLIASLCFLLLGIGLLFYIFWYMAASDQTVYLFIDNEGRVQKRT